MPPKCEPMLRRVLVYLFAVVVVMLPSSSLHAPLAAATTAQQNNDHEADIGKTAAAAEDLTELMSYANENDESATNEQVVGDINEQWGTVAEMVTEAESELRWQQIRTGKPENFDGNLKQPLSVMTSEIGEEQIKKANLKRNSARDDLEQPYRPLLIEKVAHSSPALQVDTSQQHKQRKAGHHLRPPQQDLIPTFWEHESSAEDTNTQQRQHKHKRHGNNARLVGQHQWKHKHKAMHHMRMKYSRNNAHAVTDGRHWQHKYQRHERQSKHLHGVGPDVSKHLNSVVQANNRASDELEFASMKFAETHDWYYQNDGTNNDDDPLWHTDAAGNGEHGRPAKSWALSEVMSRPSVMPENMLLGNYTYLTTSKPTMLQQQNSINEFTFGQSERHVKLTQHTLAQQHYLSTQPTAIQPKDSAAAYVRLPLLPTPATHKHEPIFADLNKWQSYAVDGELHAMPRSGRHRGRHTALPTLAQLPYTPAAFGHNGGGGKVFRSLPDSEDLNYEQHVQRMLTIQPQRHWPVKREAIVEGDVILGGLMMVHSREDTVMCGPIMPQGGIQALEAMLYTIDRINEVSLLPNITLGAHILDDCDKDSYGLEMAVDFIKGKL